MTPIHEDLTEEILPEEKRKARAICCKAGRHAVTNGVLYKKSFLGLWLRCVRPLQANYVLREIHEGSCNMHAGPRSIVAKALSCSLVFQGKSIPDNEKQFRISHSNICAKKLCIRLNALASVKHPAKPIVLVERANRSIVKQQRNTIPRLLMERKRDPNNSLVMPTLRTAKLDMIKKTKLLKPTFDHLEERKRAGSNPGSKEQS
ncbi:hypothetical protein Tco_1281031 [Tanacetum coccineum]